jgi:hypothetical protein
LATRGTRGTRGTKKKKSFNKINIRLIAMNLRDKPVLYLIVFLALPFLSGKIFLDS